MMARASTPPTSDRARRAGPRLIYQVVDDLGLDYLTLGTMYSIGWVGAQNLVQMSGVYCKHCKQGQERPGRPTEVTVGKRDKPGRWSMKWVCSNCGRDWEEAGEGELEMLRTIGKHRGPPTTEATLASRLDRWAFIRPLVESRPDTMQQARWDFNVMCWLKFISLGDRSNYTAVIEWGRLERKIFAPWFKPYIVPSSIRAAQKSVRKRGWKAGIDFTLEPRRLFQ